MNLGKKEKEKNHPLEKARELNKPYIYWHVREVYEETIKEAIKRGSSIEIDIAYDEDNGSIYIGHPKEFYTIEKKIPLPNNIDIDKAVEMLAEVPDVVLILDCKHKKTLPKIKEIINRLGVHRCILHSFIKEWSVPYTEGTHLEAHWQTEDVPYEEIRKFINDTGVKTIGAIHVLSEKSLREEKLLDRALAQAQGFESVSIYLPEANVPSKDFLEKIFKAGFLPWVNQEELNKSNLELDFAYVGISDNPSLTTITKIFLNK